MSDFRPWDLLTLSSTERSWIEEALSKTAFDFKLLIPGLKEQVHRDYIPVTFADLSQFRITQLARSGERVISDGEGILRRPEFRAHERDGVHPVERDLPDGRRAVLGLAYYSGKVVIERTCPKPLAQEVFLAEGAHMVDFFYIQEPLRQRIKSLYCQHTDKNCGWFEETGDTDYWSWVGESFMYGFTNAFSTVPTTGDSFVHATTPDIAAQIRSLFQPDAPFRFEFLRMQISDTRRIQQSAILLIQRLAEQIEQRKDDPVALSQLASSIHAQSRKLSAAVAA